MPTKKTTANTTDAVVLSETTGATDPQERIALLDAVALSLDKRVASREEAVAAAQQSYDVLQRSDENQKFQADRTVAERKLRDEQTVYETACELVGVDPTEYTYDAAERALVRLSQDQINAARAAVQSVPAGTAA